LVGNRLYSDSGDGQLNDLSENPTESNKTGEPIAKSGKKVTFDPELQTKLFDEAEPTIDVQNEGTSISSLPSESPIGIESIRKGNEGGLKRIPRRKLASFLEDVKTVDDILRKVEKLYKEEIKESIKKRARDR